MSANYVALFMNLLTADISILLAAKGMQVDRSQEAFTNKLAVFIFSKYKKKTKMQYLPLVCNSLLTIVSIVMSFTESINGNIDFGQIMVTISTIDASEYRTFFVGLLWIILLTAIFMLLTYRALVVNPMHDTESGNRYLIPSEVNEAYINFSMPENIDARSTLLLLAGDLTFLNDIPDVERIKKENRRKKCIDYLTENNIPCRCQAKRCPIVPQKCMAQSEQFTQLMELHSCGIKLHILCKQPKNNGDHAYKRRLGRLKKLFEDDLEIRFLPDESLGNEICVLGRIKRNGGIEELLWHWKSTRGNRTYTVPNIKRGDTSENKTLIFLLSKVLWEKAEVIPKETLNEYVKEYEKVFQRCIGNS